MKRENDRTAKILINGEWISVEPINIKLGDLFYMLEPDGTEVQNETGGYIFQAQGDAYYNLEGIVTVVCDVKEGE